jgi:hypothetical protein
VRHDQRAYPAYRFNEPLGREERKALARGRGQVGEFRPPDKPHGDAGKIPVAQLEPPEIVRQNVEQNHGVDVGHQNDAAGPKPPKIVGLGRRCLYCLGPLTNGSAVCCETCDQGWWDVCPTVDGELWT